MPTYGIRYMHQGENIIFSGGGWGGGREYELMTEAHAKLSVVRNCSKSSLRVCLGEREQLAGGGWSVVAEGGGRRGRADQAAALPLPHPPG
jgi:hypothetical protein